MTTRAIYDFIGKIPVSSPLGFILFGYRGGELIEHVDYCERSIGKFLKDEKSNAAKSPDIKHITDLIEDWLANPSNLGHDFTMDDLKDGIGISRRQIIYYFQHGIRQDFRSWKTERKIRLSMEIMKDDPSLPIPRVAEAVGFRDKSNFHRQFLRVTGTTPGQWKINMLR